MSVNVSSIFLWLRQDRCVSLLLARNLSRIRQTALLPTCNPWSLKIIWKSRFTVTHSPCLSPYGSQRFWKPIVTVPPHRLLSSSSARLNRHLTNSICTIEGNTFFVDSFANQFFSSEFFVKICQIFFGYHLANWNQKFFELLLIEDAVVVTIEEIEIFLVLLLFFRGNVFLNFFLGVCFVFVDGT